MPFQTLPPAGVTYRSPAKIRGALPDRQIQPFDKRRVQRRRILGPLQSFLESPFCPNHGPPFHLDDPIVPTGLDHLPVDTGRPKDLPDDSFIELESVRGDQSNTFVVRSFSNIAKQGQRVFVAASADDSRRPKPGPNLDDGEDPGWLLLTFDDRSDLVGLKSVALNPVVF